MMSRSTRSTRLTRAASQSAVTAAAPQHDSSEEVDMSEDEAEQSQHRRPTRNKSSSTPAAATSVLAHQQRLAFGSLNELAAHTRSLLRWRDEESTPSVVPTELDTSCFFAMVGSMPPSIVRALFANELDDASQLELATTVLNVIRYGDGGKDIDEFIRTIRAWSEMARQVEYDPTDSNDDFWMILSNQSITPRNLVTFCYLLLTHPQSIDALQAFTLYTSLLELASLTSSLSSVMHELTMRAGQVVIRKWAREDARLKEAGFTKRSKGKKIMSNPDPFAADNDTAEGADGVDDGWLSESIVPVYVVDLLATLKRVYTSPSKERTPKVSLFKYVELAGHLQDTLIDVLRTDIDVAARSSAAAAKGPSSPTAILYSHSLDLLLCLIHPSHGPVATVLQSILKSALLTCTLAYGPPSQVIPRHMVKVQRAGVTLLRAIIQHTLTRDLIDEKALVIAVYHFLQHLVLRASDRADFRKVISQQCSKEILEFELKQEEQEEHVKADDDGDDGVQFSSHMISSNFSTFFTSLRLRFHSFLLKMSSHKKSHIRNMALDVVQAAFTHTKTTQTTTKMWIFETNMETTTTNSNNVDGAKQAQRPSLSTFDPDVPSTSVVDLSTSMQLDSSFELAAAEGGLPASTGFGRPLAASLLAIVVRRCNDASPVVRAKALMVLAHILEHVATIINSKDENDHQLTQFKQQWSRCMEESIHTSSTTPTNEDGSSIRRAFSAPLSSSIVVNTSTDFAFLRTPLAVRSRSDWRTPAAVDGTIDSYPTHAPKGSIFHPSLPGVRDILEVLSRRSTDEKAIVRKAALQALESILIGGAAEEEAMANNDGHDDMDDDGADGGAPNDGNDVDVDMSPSNNSSRINRSSSSTIHNHSTLNRSTQNATFTVLTSLTASDLSIFYDGCFDRSLSIRKQSLLSLSSLVRQFNQRRHLPSDATFALIQLQKVWIGAVLPLIRDQESTVVQATLKVVDEIIIQPLTKILAKSNTKKKKNSNSNSKNVVDDADADPIWHMLSLLDAELLHHFSSIFLAQLKSGEVSTDLLKGLAKEMEHTFLKDDDDEEGGEEEKSASAHNSSTRRRIVWVLLECVCRFPSSLASHPAILASIGQGLSRTWSKLIDGGDGASGSPGDSIDESIVIRILACQGLWTQAGRCKPEQLIAQGEFLIRRLKAVCQPQVKHQPPSTSSPNKYGGVSGEVLKKQVWLLHATCGALSSSSSPSSTRFADWLNELLQLGESGLAAFLKHAANSTTTTLAATAPSTSSHISTLLWNEVGLSSILFLLGEIVLQCPVDAYKKGLVSTNLVKAVQTFIAPTLATKGRKSNTAYTNTQPIASSEDANMIDDSSATLNLSQSSFSDLDLSTASSSLLPSDSLLPLSGSLRAHAFLALGKFCLRDELLAKRCMLVFIRELNLSNTDAIPIIQNNILIILCDLCRNFTSIVDPYLSSITSMLASKNVLLRKHTIMILNVLLQEEYLRMKSSSHAGRHASTEEDTANGAGGGTSSIQTGSSMFYRYLRCLVDDDAGIRQLVQVSLKSILATPTASAAAATHASGGLSSTKMHMHFVELIYFLNQCHEHPIYNQFRNTGSSGAASKEDAFCLVGPLGSIDASKRFTLYKYCLSLMSDEQKFLLMGKLHTDVLQLVNESGFQTSPWQIGLRINDVIQDTLLILASEAMQLAATKKASSGLDADSVEGDLAELALAEEHTDAAAGGSKSALGIATIHAQQAAKQKLLTKLLRKSTIDTCLPILFELRSSFEKVHSSLSEYLNLYFIEIMNHHPNEIGEVFAANRMLEREIKYDIKRWNDQQDSSDENGRMSEYSRWKKLDFHVQTNKLFDTMTPGATSMPPESTRKRSSLAPSGGIVANTPLKSSSLSALRVATSTPLVNPTPNGMFKRTLSTPAGATHAHADRYHAQPATPVTLRTPGHQITTPMLRRSLSTPMSTAKIIATAGNGTTRSRRSTGAPVTPSRLVEGSESGSDTDVDDGDVDPSNLIVLAPPSDPRRTSGIWNVAIPRVDGELDDDLHVDGDAAVLSSAPAAKKARVAIAPPSSALDQLRIAPTPTQQATIKEPKKRKHQQTNNNNSKETEEDNTNKESVGHATKRTNAKRKATR